MNAHPARVLAWISPAAPWGADAPEAPVERAAQNALMSTADFYVAIKQVTTVDEALKLHRIIEEVSVSMASAAQAALLKADTL